ncbi:uncharacterized protein LOC132757759 [Ruditapes philippinarum]|uniref:uncharacterized protein LOC132757759 n=1 Tax=Ruditapes philippinarum TaxID=129788 RepID=UPI00295B7F6E|nr:uncharacterized protein LOC132757759 [Ruditapes philippinarum]
MEHLARVLRFYGPYLLSLVGMERGQRDGQHSGGEGAHGTNDTEILKSQLQKAQRQLKKAEERIKAFQDEVTGLKKDLCARPLVDPDRKAKTQQKICSLQKSLNEKDEVIKKHSE